MRFSQRRTEHHWLYKRGRSRHEWTQSLYFDQMIVSLVGLMTRGSSSSSPPPIVTTASSGAKPSTCSASFLRKLIGMSMGK